MIVINNTKYESYLDFCKAFDISYAEFINYRRGNNDISELELLGHFIPNIAVSMKTGEYVIMIDKK